MSGYDLNEQQLAAVAAGGEVFVSAGAGTGKTAVLVERVVRAVCDRGLELAPGLTLSGKIDRIDVDPFGARGVVQDYKSGKSAYSARQIESELRLQIPLYMLVLRDLVGLEPLGGLYRPLAGARKPRGLVRGSEAETLPGYVSHDYLDEEAFWGVVESARSTATKLAGRMRAGDVRHDPLGGECPAWCDLWTVCRIERA